MGYLDGACQGVPRKTRVGGIILFDEDHKIIFKVGMGEGVIG